MEKHIKNKLEFYKNFVNSTNAATGSKFDANANVTEKNIAVLASEMVKKDAIDFQRVVMEQYITKLYGKKLAKQYEKDLKNHIIYRHDESSGAGGYPYCCSITLYPFLLDGLKNLGGTSGAPQHANSFIGSLINLIYLVSGQFAGAVACPEALVYLDYYLRKDYGQDYTNHLDKTLETIGERKLTLRGKIHDLFQQFVYCINQPASARGYQSPFTNISYYDKGYFNAIFKDFVFPDGDTPKWETVKELQKLFINWFSKEREKAVLTFPVETWNLLTDGENYVDKETFDFVTQMCANGHTPFFYQSESADALSSCCFSGDEIVKVKTPRGLTKKLTIKSLCEKLLRQTTQCEKVFDTKYKTISVDAEGLFGQEESRITGALIKKNEYNRLIEITAGKSTIKVTPDHIMVVLNGNTKRIEIVRAGVLLHNYNNYYVLGEKTETLITSIKEIIHTGYVYDIQLEKNHYFYANDILTHNCRLRNGIEKNEFSYTLGAGGIKTGSIAVITLNLNRITQDWYNTRRHKETFKEYLIPIVDRVHKYLNAFRQKLEDDMQAGLLTVYKAGFISLEDQYSTVGINGLVEAAEFLGYNINKQDNDYREFVNTITSTISERNKLHRTDKTYRLVIKNHIYDIPKNESITVINGKSEKIKVRIEDILLTLNNYSIDSKDLEGYRV